MANSPVISDSISRDGSVRQLKWLRRAPAILIGAAFLLSVATPALAHHPLGGRIPGNFFEGFMSGLAHPVIGLDHLAFIVAVGFLSALNPGKLWLPLSFVLAALGGTGLHLMKFNIPAVEVGVALSVLIFGLLLAARRTPDPRAVVLMGSLAGLLHGYAYGEAIIGAQMTPLTAYLTGFTAIQLAIALGVNQLSQKLMAGSQSMAWPSRVAGFAIAGIGIVFLSRALLA